MSRSYNKKMVTCYSLAKRDSEKQFKKMWHKKLRCKINMRVKNILKFSENEIEEISEATLPIAKEVINFESCTCPKIFWSKLSMKNFMDNKNGPLKVTGRSVWNMKPCKLRK